MSDSMFSDGYGDFQCGTKIMFKSISHPGTTLQYWEDRWRNVYTTHRKSSIGYLWIGGFPMIATTRTEDSVLPLVPPDTSKILVYCGNETYQGSKLNHFKMRCSYYSRSSCKSSDIFLFHSSWNYHVFYWLCRTILHHIFYQTAHHEPN